MTTNSHPSISPDDWHSWKPLLVLTAFACLWWLLPRALAFAFTRLALAVTVSSQQQKQEAILLTELRENRQTRRQLANTQANFVAISRLDRRANRLRADLAPLRTARSGRAGLTSAGAALAARALANASAAWFLYHCRGMPVLRLPLLADWFAPFHWLLTLGGSDAAYLTSTSLVVLCLGTVSLASGLARCPAVCTMPDAAGGFGDSSGSGCGGSLGLDAFVAEATKRAAAVSAVDSGCQDVEDEELLLPQAEEEAASDGAVVNEPMIRADIN